MACWVVLVIVIPCLYFAGRSATDFSTDPPKYWQCPASYGQAVLLAAIVWSIGWLSPVLWLHRNAFDREDLSEAKVLLQDLLPELPVGLGVLAVGAGLFMISAAFTRRGQQPHCRCGYQRAATGWRLTPICPECGRRWSWFGDAILGQPHFIGPRAAAGALIAALGLTAIILQFIN